MASTYRVTVTATPIIGRDSCKAASEELFLLDNECIYEAACEASKRLTTKLKYEHIAAEQRCDLVAYATEVLRVSRS